MALIYVLLLKQRPAGTTCPAQATSHQAVLQPSAYESRHAASACMLSCPTFLIYVQIVCWLAMHGQHGMASMAFIVAAVTWHAAVTPAGVCPLSS